MNKIACLVLTIVSPAKRQEQIPISASRRIQNGDVAIRTESQILMLTNRCLTLVVALWGGLFLSPRAAEPVRAGVSPGDAGSDLYAYYTALDYTIPLSEIRMNVPFSNEEQVQAWRKAVENDTPRNAPQPENPIMKVGTACPNFGGMLKGSLEAVCIYNRKLGSDEVSRLAAGEVVKGALVAHYPFNQNMADSGGGKPAIPHGGAGFSSGRRAGSQALQLDGRSIWVQLPVETPHDGYPRGTAQDVPRLLQSRRQEHWVR
jgi:hypothetical protein